MNKLETILKLAELVGCENSKKSHNTFFEIGKIYAVRTVTMIYVGRLKNINDTEILLESAAWVAETERLTEFNIDASHKEAEIFKNDLVIKQGAIVDYTEVSKLILKQK